MEVNRAFFILKVRTKAPRKTILSAITCSVNSLAEWSNPQFQFSLKEFSRQHPPDYIPIQYSQMQLEIQAL